MSKRILMVLTTERPFPPDIRVEKEAHALAAAGFEVRILTARTGPEEAEEERLGDSTVVIERVRPKRKIWGLPRSAARFVRSFTEHYLYRPDWEPAIRKAIEGWKPDAIHVHDFDLVPTTVTVARDYDLPVVADLHENLPAAVEQYLQWAKPSIKVKNLLVNHPRMMRKMERVSLPQCKLVITVVPEAAERMEGYMDRKNIAVISNTENFTTFPWAKDLDLEARWAESGGGKRYVSYVGGVGPHRGVNVAIEAMARLPKDHGLTLRIVGATGDRKRRLEEMVVAEGVSEMVELVEWVPFEEVQSYLVSSEVCIVPHADTEHTQTTVPHKLFQYMIMGCPVLVSSCAPLKRIVEDAGCGKVFTADDAQSFADCLYEMTRDRKTLKAMSGAGREAAMGKYSWDGDAANLVAAYHRVTGSEETNS